MSSQDFQKVLVKDDRLVVSDQIKYAVCKGGQNMTSAQFNAISQSTSSHTYNIQCPSEQTIVDRRVLWQSQVTLAINTSQPAGGVTPAGQDVRPAGSLLVNYGSQDALAPFPLHQLCSVMTATVNNNSTSINMRDVLAPILRFHDRRELARYNGYTPVMYDTYLNYKDGLGSNNNVLGGWSLTADNDLNQRGSWVLDSISRVGPNAVGFPEPITPADDTVYVTYTVTEPLLLSPFIYAHTKSNNSGFYGIQNMNFIFNIADGNRAWRSSNNWGQSITVNRFNNSRLIFNFLTPHPSDLMPSRNVCGYYELPRYITANLPAFGAAGTGISQQTIRTTTIQLNQIPDKIVLFVRKAMGDQRAYDSDSFLVINSLSINFNNMSGILASATQQDLYRYSIENGSNQSWYEFSGVANKSSSATGGGLSMPTTGSLVILEFGKDIQLVEDFYASGSLGNFNLQINMTVSNQSNVALPNTEVVLITMNSGVWVNERGTSTVYTGILTKQDVLDVSSQESYSRSDVKRLVGGGFLDTIKSVAGKVLPKLPGLAKMGLSMINNPYAQKGADVLGALGYGRSGGGSSGGGYSGGAKHKLESRLE
jgi:hypothetical protein